MLVLSLLQNIYTGCLNPDAFQRLAAVYKRLKEAKGIVGPVPTQMSEDETKIDSSIVFDLAANTLVGFCGDEGDSHTCSLDGVRVNLPAGPDGICATLVTCASNMPCLSLLGIMPISACVLTYAAFRLKFSQLSYILALFMLLQVNPF